MVYVVKIIENKTEITKMLYMNFHRFDATETGNYIWLETKSKSNTFVCCVISENKTAVLII